MNRRRFITNTALTFGTLAGGIGDDAARAALPATTEPGRGAGAGELVDTHVYISRWPYRRVPGDETPQLVKRLKEYGVTSAWVGSFDALLHRDIAAVNARLVAECAGQRDVHLIPFGAVNPTLPDWEEDLRRCHEVHRMPGIRLHPDFHAYTLKDPRFERLLDLATQRRLVVQIGLGMEDTRLQGPLGQVPPADPEPLVDLLPKYPAARVELLNFWRSFRANRVLQARLVQLPQVAFDLATVEVVAGLEELLHTTPSLRLLFGSYAPFYNFGSSWRKLGESILTPGQLAAIRHGHAMRLLSPA